ncbi:MAG: amidase [Bacteroidota bacterium]
MPLPLPEYDRLDATDLARLVRAGEVSPEELAEAALARVEARGEPLGAFTHVERPEAVIAQATSAPDGPFRGVPFPVKDLMHAVAGMPMRSGSEAFRHFVPEADSTLITRYRAAGLVFVGKTSVPEFGLMGVTEPQAYGPARNPWAPERSPGGSSGGAGAAVAARIAPAASASDGGGSIRIPASFGGVFGLKPSRGRVPEGPFVGESWHGAAASLAITRTVRDAAALLDVAAGPSPGDPVALARPATPFADEVGRAPGRLRIGFTATSPLGTPVDPACVRAVTEAAALLERLGHDVEEAAPEVDGRAIARGYLTLYFGQVAAAVRRSEEIVPGARQRVEPATRLLAQIGESLSAGQYVTLLDGWNDLGRAVGRFHERYDLYLTPTAAALPPEVGAQDPTATERLLMQVAIAARAGGLLLKTGFVDRLVDERLAATPFTQLANLAGLPAMSVPMLWTDPGPGAPRGLPVGVQVVARPAEEAVLLRLAAQIEAERPWADREPALVETAAVPEAETVPASEA